MFIFCGVKDVWAFGLIFLAFYPFFGLAFLGPHLPIEPMFSFSMSVGLLAIDHAISLHHTRYNFTFPFTSGYLVDLWVDIPAVLAHFFVNILLRAS